MTTTPPSTVHDATLLAVVHANIAVTELFKHDDQSNTPNNMRAAALLIEAVDHLAAAAAILGDTATPAHHTLADDLLRAKYSTPMDPILDAAGDE